MTFERTLMKNARLCLTFFMLFILLTGCGGAGSQPPAPTPATEQENGQAETSPQTLTVSAAASLTDVMEEIKKLYEARAVHTLIINYGSSGALQHQVEQGAPVDVFISAAQRQMDLLQERNLILTESRVDLLENEVVLIVPVTPENKDISDFSSLTVDSLNLLAIGEPESVPAGRYAKETLSNLGLWEMLEKKLVLAKDVRQVLTYVETGNVDAGIVYKTDALASEKVSIMASAPPGSHTPVTYPAAVVSNSSARQAAEDFMTFLQSDKAVELFERHGFTFIARKQAQ